LILYTSFPQKAGTAALISKHPVTLNNGSGIVLFDDLDDNTTYVAKLVFFEAGDLSDFSRSPELNFTSQACEPLGKTLKHSYLMYF